MRHTRDEVITRVIREYRLLDALVSGLSEADWARPLGRPEAKDPWTIKDALAHITHWKADTARAARRERRPLEERGLNESEGNHLVYDRWHDRPAGAVMAWHRQVQADVLATLRAAPDGWFSGRDRLARWPFDLDGHSAEHRIADIDRALTSGR
jgi:hypothetical protein